MEIREEMNESAGRGTVAGLPSPADASAKAGFAQAGAPRWERGRIEGRPGAVLALPLGVTLVLMPFRTAAGPFVWGVFIYVALNPCRNRAYRCTSWRAAKALIRDELNDLGWMP